MCGFDTLWQRAQASDLDSACATLEGVLELIQHHPAITPEVEALRQLIAAWWRLIPSWETRRSKLFAERLEHARALRFESAVDYLLTMRVGFAKNARLALECALIDQLIAAWKVLRDNPISERARLI